MTTSPDVELVRRIADGDQTAFELFYARYSARINGLLLKMLGTSAEAEDVLQEVFWQIWSKAGQFDSSRGTPFAWLILIARSRALDRRRRRLKEPIPAEEPPETQLAADVAESVADAERVRQAQTNLDQLPDEQKDAIRLSFYDGLSHSEIAERADLPLGTVKTRIRAGMSKLRDLMAVSERGSYA